MPKKHLITFLTLIAINVSLTSPAKSNFRKSGFGEGTAALACFLLWEGYSKYEVERLISRFARRIGKSNFSEAEMTLAFSYPGAKNQIRSCRQLTNRFQILGENV